MTEITVSRTLQTIQCALAMRIPAVCALAGRLQNKAHYCQMYTNFACAKLNANAGKSGEPILHTEPPHIKISKNWHTLV
jgi:hypothetical protein